MNIHLHLVSRSKNDRNCTIPPPIRLHGMVLSYITGTTLPLLYYKGKTRGHHVSEHFHHLQFLVRDVRNLEKESNSVRYDSAY